MTLPNKMHQQLPKIGVMDSGVGGLSVLTHCLNLLPQAEYLYMADSQYAPYGSKTSDEIQARCLHIAQLLLDQSVDAIVVACNTATAAAIKSMRSQYNLPIIGMEPAVKPAVQATRTQQIGVLATTGTLKSAQFAALLANYGQAVTVTTQGCEGLVECVERGEIDTVETMALLRRYCAPLMSAKVDTIVLGCTHYPFLASQIQSIVGEEVSLIETGHAVAKQLVRQLALESQAATKGQVGKVSIMTNQMHDNAAAIIERLFQPAAEVSVSQQAF